MRLPLAQAVVVLVAVGLVAVAVSAAGPITFVALVVPQIAVRLTGGVAPAAARRPACSAPCWWSARDLVTRTVLPAGLPVGILTAADRRALPALAPRPRKAATRP